MRLISQIIAVLSWGAMLCLDLSIATQKSNAASPAEERKADVTDHKQSGRDVQNNELKPPMTGEQLQSSKTISGEVLRVEGDNYFVKAQDGKEVRLHADDTTINIGNIRPGDRIEANVDNQNHALTIRSSREADMYLSQ